MKVNYLVDMSGFGMMFTQILNLEETLRVLKYKDTPTKIKRKILNDYPILKIYI